MGENAAKNDWPFFLGSIWTVLRSFWHWLSENQRSSDALLGWSLFLFSMTQIVKRRWQIQCSTLTDEDILNECLPITSAADESEDKYEEPSSTNLPKKLPTSKDVKCAIATILHFFEGCGNVDEGLFDSIILVSVENHVNKHIRAKLKQALFLWYTWFIGYRHRLCLLIRFPGTPLHTMSIKRPGDQLCWKNNNF